VTTSVRTRRRAASPDDPSTADDARGRAVYERGGKIMNRRPAMRALLLMGTCIALGGASASHAARIDDLGVAVRAVVYGNSQGCLAESPSGGPGMFYIPYFSTTGGALVGIHPRSGERVHVPLPSRGGYGTAVGADGAIYVGGVHPGDLYRFEPGTGQLEALGGSQFGATYIWACAASPHANKIYAACYPTAGLLEYDLSTRTLRNLGRMSETEQYVRSVAVDAQGKVWAGIGTHADLVVWDPKTETHRSVLPDPYKHNSCAYDVCVSGGHVFAKLLYDHKHLVYDARAEKPVTVLGKPPDGLSYMAARGGHDGCFYLYATLSGTLYRYRVGQAKPEKLADRLGQVAVVEKDRYAYAIDDQDFVYYDLAEHKEIFRCKLAEATDGMAVYALAAGTDGRVYGSTYINMHMFSVDPEDGTIADLGKALRWGGQIDSMHGGRDGKIYLGSYVHAVVSVYDPAKPWKIGTARDCNPREIGPVGSGQYRTRCITLGPDGRIYVGSIPSYNSAPTGAFSRVDPETGEVRTWLDLVPGGAVNCVVADDNYVYGAGGGVFFVLDPDADEADPIVHKLDLPVSAMALAPSGEIVGTGGGQLFVFSPSQMQLVHMAANPLGDFTHMCAAPDGNIYGINPSRIARIAPGTWQPHEVAAPGGKFLAPDPQARLHFARGSRVLRITFHDGR
jgi:outer membrane protein assembly factor BamB